MTASATATVINFEDDKIAVNSKKKNKSSSNNSYSKTTTKPKSKTTKTIEKLDDQNDDENEVKEIYKVNSKIKSATKTENQTQKCQRTSMLNELFENNSSSNNSINGSNSNEQGSKYALKNEMNTNEVKINDGKSSSSTRTSTNTNSYYHRFSTSKSTKSQTDYVCFAAALAATVVASAQATEIFSQNSQENISFSSPYFSTTFGYYEARDTAAAVNRSLLLTSLTGGAEDASNGNFTATTTTTALGNSNGSINSSWNATSTISTAIATATSTSVHDEEWSHFYDLILSWRGICLIAVFSTFIVITIIGNTLVILAVITTRRLKTVTNCFVMSLAVADLLVGIFVMPPAVAVHLIGSWQLGWVLCDIWISLDVLLCTASILSLCAISVDRYLAVTQPLTYSRKRRSKRLALIMILIVWILALAITCPPMLGWYEPGRRDLSECRYNQNEGYVIFSAMGSFFIPMAVMIYVYTRISCVIASRHDNMTDISVHNKKFKRYTAADVDNDIDHDLSEQELTSTQKKQVAVRTFSNQTIVKELHEVMLSDSGENCGSGVGVLGGGVSGGTKTATHCHSLLALPTENVNKNGCYELTRPTSLRRSPTPSVTVSSTGMSSIGADADDVQQQQQPLQQQHQHHWTTRTHSMRQQQQHQQQQQYRVSIGSSSILTTPHHQHQHHQHQHHHNANNNTQIRQTRICQQHQHQQQHLKSLTNRISSLKKENKTTQTLSIVVGGFIACWLPFFVYYLITPFLEEHQVSATFAKALTWLGWFNSAINPFIYAFYSVDFRAAFWRLTCKRFFSGSSKPQFPSNTMSIRR